jgi:hypothetical protein
MKFETTNNKFLGKWDYQVQFAFYFDWVQDDNGRHEKWRSKKEQQGIETIVSYLGQAASGAWERVGNSFYFTDLDDAFRLRLYFDRDLKTVRQYQP